MATTQRAEAVQTLAYPTLAHLTLNPESPRPAVIGLHGLASAGRALLPVLAPLADQGTPVFLPDLLGYGASPYPPGLSYTIDDHLAALAAWAETTIPAWPVWLVGSSLGALVALAWAAKQPERVRGVVAMSIPLFTSTNEARAHLGRGDPMARLMLRSPRMAHLPRRTICGRKGPAYRLSILRLLQPRLGRLLLRAYGPRDLTDPNLMPLEAMTTCFIHGLADTWLHSWDSVYCSFRHCLVERRHWPDLEAVRAAGTPVLFLHGKFDGLAPIANAREAANFGGWPLYEYDNASHAISATHAPVLSQRVAQFLAGDQLPMLGETQSNG